MILGLLDEAMFAGARQASACEILELDVRTVQRWRHHGIGDDRRVGPRTSPSNKLSSEERQQVLATACSPDFRDLSPKQIVPTLADDGQYIASESTFYRVLHEEGLLKHRGRARAPQSRPRPKPKIADGPGQLWSWDITYLRSPVRGQYYYLYMMIDVWSRKIVGHAVHKIECTDHAAALIRSAHHDEGLTPEALTLHSDNGGPMKGATMLATLERLGIAASFSRPRVSDDNPYSESLFRTLKYSPRFPSKPFESIEAARAWVDSFVAWYNDRHLHSGIGFITPADRHAGRHEQILDGRRRVLEAARAKNPKRWSGSIRKLDHLPVIVLHPELEEVAAA
jgi:putative transposase